MNIQLTTARPRPLKLAAADFLLLKSRGAFHAFSKADLIEGKLIGVPVQADDEPESDASVPIKLRVSDYEMLAREGTIAEYGRTELVDGAVYEVSPQHRPHGFIKDELAYRLRRCLEDRGSDLRVATEQSVALAPHDEPQPDIMLTTEPRGAGAIPGASVGLIVEIAASTLSFDLGEKAHAYAAAGIPEYWVADVNARVVHQMWSPDGEAYAERREVAFGNAVTCSTVEGLTVDTASL